MGKWKGSREWHLHAWYNSVVVVLIMAMQVALVALLSPLLLVHRWRTGRWSR